MRLKPEHLRHPFRTAVAAKERIAARLNMKRCADNGVRRFRGDPRYALESVTAGFASRLAPMPEDEQRREAEPDDAALLRRICSAYIRAVEDEACVSPAYRATAWWEEIRQHNLKPVMRALSGREIGALDRMYRNFFRDPCSAGLVGVPWSGALFGDASKDLYRRFYLSDALQRIDYWKAQTDGRFELSELAGPGTGNPFGVLIEGTLVRTGSEYQHYCAHRVMSLLDSQREVTVVEIGGGFGDMAYYLLRDRPGTAYVNFDLPETIALASYYLLKAFPERRFVLYGEDEPGSFDVVLMPAFALAAMPAESADVVFCSHLLSDVSGEAVVEYLDQITRIARESFLFVGSGKAAEQAFDLLRRGEHRFTLTATRRSEWHRHRAAKWDEVECLYSAAGDRVCRC